LVSTLEHSMKIEFHSNHPFYIQKLDV
jgi:hypothetical protein